MAESVGRDSLYVDGLYSTRTFAVQYLVIFINIQLARSLLQLPLNHSVHRIILVLSGSFRVGRSLNRQSHPSSG